MEWFLYDRDLRHERGKNTHNIQILNDALDWKTSENVQKLYNEYWSKTDLKNDNQVR